MVLGLGAQDISAATADSGIGRWSVSLVGRVSDVGGETNSGVTLTVPETTAKNAETYSTTVICDLVTDLAVDE